MGKSHTVELSAKSHSEKLEPWADICLCTLGKSPTLVPSVKNHWLKWRSEEPYAQCSPTVERSRTYAQSVKSSTKKVVIWELIHTGEKPIQLPDPIQEHALLHE